LIEKKDIDKRVRSLTKLTKDHAVADLTADFFDSMHPIPEVCIFVFTCLLNFVYFDLRCFLPLYPSDLFYTQGHQFIVSHPPLPEAGPLLADLASSVSEDPEADDTQDGDDAEESKEETSSSTSSPSVPVEDAGVDKKRKRVEEFASSSFAAAAKTSAPTKDEEYFNLLAS
jgi:hypothetical protein